MSWSAAEISALGAKAARGAGVPAAQAAQFGAAAARHLQAGRSAEDLSHALRALPGGPILDLALGLLDVRKGVLPFGAARWEGLAQSYLDTLPWAVEGLELAEDCLHFRIDPNRPAVARESRRIALPPDLQAQMEALAQRTFVPETDASRRAGAGAGLTDND